MFCNYKAAKKSNTFTLRHILILTDVMLKIETYKLSNNFYLPNSNTCQLSVTTTKLYNPVKQSWNIVYWLNRRTLYRKGKIEISTTCFTFLFFLVPRRRLTFQNFRLLLKSFLTEICQVKELKLHILLSE